MHPTGIVPRDAEALRRVATLLRFFGRYGDQPALIAYFLPPPASQTPLVPPRAISILDSWVGGFLVWQAARQNLFLKSLKMSNEIAAGEQICNRGSLVSGWVCGLLLLFFRSP